MKSSEFSILFSPLHFKLEDPDKPVLISAVFLGETVNRMNGISQSKLNWSMLMIYS